MISFSVFLNENGAANMWQFVGLKVVRLLFASRWLQLYICIYIYMYTMYDIHRLTYFCMIYIYIQYIYIKIKVIHYLFVDLCCRLLEELRPTTWDVPDPH